MRTTNGSYEGYAAPTEIVTNFSNGLKKGFSIRRDD